MFDSQGEVTYVQQVAPSCPAGTTADAYTTTGTGLASCWLWGVNIKIPAGHAGVTGIALLDGGQFIVPYAAGLAWIIGDDDDLSFAYNKQVGVNTVLATYNTSTQYDHGWQVRLVYTPLSAMAPDGAAIDTPDYATLAADLARFHP